MRSCRTASIVAVGALFGLGMIGACRESVPAEVPPVTMAQPTSSTDPVLSGPATDASLATAPPALIEAGAAPVRAEEPPMKVAIADLPLKVEMTPCSEATVALVSGAASVLGEKL
ncbi:MAG: hypothetical protein K0S65_3368, partial [Labilithrix sp.]|nr:hypothetical protein [Labilithrix sp.]